MTASRTAADTLRAAAAHVREATPAIPAGSDVKLIEIMLVRPGVALAVAQWLHEEALTIDAVEAVDPDHPALEVARLVLGEKA